jgi:molybdate transport system substrate-binding protein
MTGLTRRILLASLLAAPALANAVQAASKVTVFAAASLKTALDGVAALWKARTGNETAISYAATSALARQIENGAPADVFISADLDWMAYLGDRDLVVPASKVDLLGNEIVLVAAADSPASVTIAKDFPLAASLGDGRLALANVAAVPAGKYARASLEWLGVWPQVKDKLAQAENVRAALKLVATGEAPLGIVYRSDAVAEPAVKVIGTFPPQSHPPIIYPAALVSGAANADAAAFLAFLQTPDVAAIFRAQGFTVPAPSGN